MKQPLDPSGDSPLPDLSDLSAGPAPVRVLFVCLGNICRSPAAEGVTGALAAARGLSERLHLDSAGLYGGHAGDQPDRRMRIHAARRGYDLHHPARQVHESDFDDFDIIVAMDDSNVAGLRRLAQTADDERKIVRMTDFARLHPYYDSVPDPYYEGAAGFELVLDLLEDACAGLLDSLFP